MKRIFLSLVIALFAFTASAQNEANVLWTMRITPKMDKIGELEKKLPLFLKTHYPQLSFRVYEVLTGPKTGSFFIASGPYAFKDFDAPMQSPKGEAAQKADDLALIALSESIEVQHARVLSDISLPDPNREIKYVQVTERQYETGSWSKYRDFLRKLKTAREKGPKVDIVYFQPVGGGDLNTFVAARFFTKWEELDINMNLAELYDNAHGRAAWAGAMREINAINKSANQEIRMLRKDLSTTATPAK